MRAPTDSPPPAAPRSPSASASPSPGRDAGERTDAAGRGATGGCEFVRWLEPDHRDDAVMMVDGAIVVVPVSYDSDGTAGPDWYRADADLTAAIVEHGDALVEILTDAHMEWRRDVAGY